jgi:hypothetical protein
MPVQPVEVLYQEVSGVATVAYKNARRDGRVELEQNSGSSAATWNITPIDPAT